MFGFAANDEPPQKPPGPPAIQNLLDRMEQEEHGSGQAPDPAGKGDGDEIDPKLLYTTTFLQLVVIPALLLGPRLPHPNNALATGATAGLCLILAYLEHLAGQKTFFWITLVIGLALLASATVLFGAVPTG